MWLVINLHSLTTGGLVKVVPERLTEPKITYTYMAGSAFRKDNRRSSEILRSDDVPGL